MSFVINFVIYVKDSLISGCEIITGCNFTKNKHNTHKIIDTHDATNCNVYRDVLALKKSKRPVRDHKYYAAERQFASHNWGTPHHSLFTNSSHHDSGLLLFFA